MNRLIDLETYPVKAVLNTLLQDKTTGKNILWATDTYAALGAEYAAERQILPELVAGANVNIIQPRIAKAAAEQAVRTKRHAEVFTPAWICRQMADALDEEWFDRPNVFFAGEGGGWQPAAGKIVFAAKGKTWQRYVDSRRLEITCGEAPFLASRYDAATGERLAPERRMGLLDRKLRVVNENTAAEQDWLHWTKRAVQSIYGYEYQGDSLLMARINLLLTVTDAYQARWQRPMEKRLLKSFANILAWNIWQMDGLQGTIPYQMPEETYEQLTFEPPEPQPEQLSFEPDEPAPPPPEIPRCKIYDWRKKTPLEYLAIARKEPHTMKFDFAIGNPPYQDNTIGDNETFAPPVYHQFLDAAYKVADRVELIHPARFLFNAGSTPKAWNKKMLADSHFKILLYEANMQKIFANANINGGVAISYRDASKEYGAIDTFTPFPELNEILEKVRSATDFKTLSTIVTTSYAYHFTEKLYEDYPDLRGVLSVGHDYDLKSNAFEKMTCVFFESKPNDNKEYIRIYGRLNNERTYRFVRRDYINNVKNLDKYKIFLAGADGAAGTIGKPIPARITGMPCIGAAGVGTTESFMSIGCFETEIEANNTLKYVKSKFARTLLSVLKVTQAITPEKWKYVPLQDFTPQSDIDWSKSVAEIDRQLYRKYGLTQQEIDFIETHVKEMP